MAGTLPFTLAASGDKAIRRFGWSGGQLVCTEGPPPGQEVDLYFDDSDRPYKLRKALQYDREFKKFRIENNTGTAQDFELQISEPGNRVVDRSYVGQEINFAGELTVPGAPLTSEGGAIQKLGGSRYFAMLDSSGGDQWISIVDGGANLSGVYVHYLYLMLDAAPVAGPRFPFMFLIQGANANVLMAQTEKGLKERWTGIYIPPLHSLTVKLFSGQGTGYAECGYDIL